MRTILTIVLALLPVFAAAQEAPPRISVTGTGVVEAVPDMARITLGVVSTARTAAEALAANSRETGAVIAELRGAGIAERDLQTSALSLSPVWSNRRSSNVTPPEITGFEARNLLTVRVRDLPGLGGVLDLVVRSGANRFQGLSFDLQDRGPAEDEARRRAVADGLRKAALYAEAAGVALGPVLSIDEAGGGPGPMALGTAEMARAAVPVAAGELTVRASVRMVFAIGG